jgi:glycerol-3-phosphate O-acyltransferase/dihydroxyacetone phosphate acyltransferase
LRWGLPRIPHLASRYTVAVRRFLEWLSRTIVKIFFREILIEGKENLPDFGPILFTPNHPNALLDPLLVQFFASDFKVRFVAKAPLFKIPIFANVLRAMGAIPVTRKIDVNTNVDYTQFFSACVDALKQGDSIAIFPEGRSLPQPFLAPMRTGPARLFFMAHDLGIKVHIVPVGLNYERGSIFRSSVQVSIAPQIVTTPFEEQHIQDSASAVRNLTDEIGRVLDRYVFQAETYRDRELILLLDRLYSEEDRPASSWAERLDRLRIFGSAIDDLRNSHTKEINDLRHLLSRYHRISKIFRIDPLNTKPAQRSFGLFVMNSVGLIIAMIGWLFNIVPYKLTDLLVRLLHKDESEAATFKVGFGLISFPLTYVIEGWFIHRWFGWIATFSFAILIVPLTLFTMRFFEWREEIRIAGSNSFIEFGSTGRAAAQLNRLKDRIIDEVDHLADEWQKIRTNI